MTPALQISGLGVDIGGQTILGGIDLVVAPGEAVALVGESGSGKSMTLRAIAGLLPSSGRATGSIRLDGAELNELSVRARRRAVSEAVGMVFQDPREAINPVRTIGDFLTEALILARGVSQKDAGVRARGVLRDVGIADAATRMEQYPHQLSGGLLQRVMIASVLLAEPKIVLADEPTTALDVITQEEVVAILDARRREHGMAMVFVSHDLDLAAAITDRTAVMRAGELVEEGASATLHKQAQHPYTRALLAARPVLAPPSDPTQEICDVY